MDLNRFVEPDILVFLIPITAILVGGAIAVSAMWIRHRERLAMIERGMDPNSLEPKSPRAAATGSRPDGDPTAGRME